jgi:KTSC domain-containing protein
MDRQPVTSESLASVGYDAATPMLEVEFTTGRVYRYFGVPARVYADLMAASSLGAFFNARIRNAGYDYERVA